MKNEDKIFFKLCNKALNLTKYRCAYPRKLIDDGDIINDCWEKGNWRNYIGKGTEGGLIWKMSHRMVYFVTSFKFGRNNTKWNIGPNVKCNIEKNMTIRSIDDFEVCEEIVNRNEPDPYYVCSQLDAVMSIINKADAYKLELVLCLLGDYNKREIAKKVGQTGESVRLHIKEQKKVLQEKLSRKEVCYA